MRKSISILFLLLFSLVASAQVRFGLKFGENLTNLQLSGKYMDTRINQAGFFIGPTAKVPITKKGLGLDVSLMYDWRFAKYGASYSSNGVSLDSCVTRGLAYFTIPVCLRYDSRLNDKSEWFVRVGPQMAIAPWTPPGKSPNEEYNKMVWSANLGFGVFVKNTIEVALNYNYAFNSTFDGDLYIGKQPHHYQGKYHALQFSTAIYF